MPMIETETEEELDTSGRKKFAHYAEASKVTEGYVMGTPVEAVCGKMFVPTRDPKKFPVCPICKDIVNSLLLNHEE